MYKIILVGAGGHCGSVLDSIPYDSEVAGFIDDYRNGDYCGLPVYRHIEDIPDYQMCKYHITIGNVGLRKDWYSVLKEHDLDVINIIDRSAIISRSVRIGEGNYIGRHVILTSDISIGDNNIINTKALIEHGCVIGSHCNISTASILNGDVKVGDSVFFGSNAICNGQLTIETGSTIGSGAVVTKDVKSCSTVVGIPAKELVLR